MTMFTSKNLVAFALVAIASIAFLFVGCSRDEEPRTTPGEAVGEVSQPRPSRMEDQDYVAKLNATADARKQLLATRARLMAQMEEAGADRESLQARIDDLNKAIEDERRHAVSIVRQRIMSDGQKESVEK